MESSTTTKKIFRIAPLTYLFALIAIYVGLYKEFLMISFLIIIHELGHFLSAKYLGIKTDRIELYPLGGITKLQMDISEKPIKEFLILIMGPIFQNIAYFLLLQIVDNKETVSMYHFGILFFNLLPIYPLDGGKLLNILLNLEYPFKKSFKLSIYISYVVTIILFFSSKKISINAITIYLLLISLIRKEELKENLYFEKLLLERYLKEYSYKKKKRIHKIKNIYKYFKNVIIEDNQQYEEKEYFKKKYKNFRKNC